MTNPLQRDLDHVLAHTRDVWQALRGKHLFVTGGTGFVGTWLLESFVWANDRFSLNARVTALTRTPEAFLLKAPLVAQHPSVRLLPGTMQSFPFPKEEINVIIHAATDQIASTAEEPAGTFERELSGTQRILDFTRHCGVETFLFTSSGAVYGRQPPEVAHVSEDYCGAPSPVETGSAYAQAKRASEFLISAYAQKLGFKAIIPRLFAFSGPYLPLDSNFAIGNFVRDVLSGGPVKIAGDGTPLRSYLYAADLAIWLWNLLIKGDSVRPYNVGSAEAISIFDLAQLVVDTLAPGMEIQVAKQAISGAPIARYVPCIARAEQELGLHSTIPLHEQICRMHAWNRLQRSSSFP